MKRTIIGTLLATSLFAGWQDMLGEVTKSLTSPAATSTLNTDGTRERDAIKQALRIGVEKAIGTPGQKAGGETAATDYFKAHAGDELAKRIAPIIKKHMEQEEVTRYYQMMMQAYDKYARPYTQNAYAQAALGALGMDTSVAPKEGERDLSTYVTNRTLEGLYKMIARQERAIRTSAAARTTKLLQEVFGGAR